CARDWGGRERQLGQVMDVMDYW
nr:immunoglobulin heavy chain junction region [Macaca mulatta]